MIRDYHEVQTVTLPSGHGTLVAKHKLTSPIVINESVAIPVHARILRVTAKGGIRVTQIPSKLLLGTPGTKLLSFKRQYGRVIPLTCSKASHRQCAKQFGTIFALIRMP